jgi:hypothetical protein
MLPTALAALLLLGGCQTARNVDEALRRVDVLDRVFDPARFRTPPPPPPAPEPELLVKVQEPEAPAPEPIAAPVPEPLPPEPVPEPVPAAAPAPPSTAELLRRNPWLSRFWSELTPAQQARVTRRLPADTAARWDVMGLPDRARLLQGG